MSKTYYYHFKKFNFWLVLNLLLLCKMLWCWHYYPFIRFYPQTPWFFVLIGVSFVLWGYKYLLKHPLAVVTDKDIKIDHCQPLAWKDIASAEERIIRCCGKKKILVLLPKKNLKYNYNFLQKHNSDFTPFSLPLYGILTPEDEEELTDLVAKKVKIKKLK